jgi:putative addiction module component (TIGR02574 family)
MNTTLKLNQMSISEKLAVMEQIWEDISSDPKSFPSSDWHRHTLAVREERINEGKAIFRSLEETKSRIRDQIVRR